MQFTWSHTRVEWTPNLLWLVLLWKVGIWTQTHTRTPDWDKGRDRVIQQKPRKPRDSSRASDHGNEDRADSLSALRRNQPCPHHDLEFLASRTVRKQIPVFKLPGLWYFVKTAPASKYSHLTSYNLQPCPTLCDPMDCSPPGSSVSGILQARILEGAAITLLQGIFPTSELNPVLPHCRQILYWLSHQGSLNCRKAFFSMFNSKLSVLEWRWYSGNFVLPLPKRHGSVADNGKSFDQVADSQSTEHILCRRAQRFKPWLPLTAFPFTPGQVIEVYPTQTVRERTMQYSEGELPAPIFSSQGKGAWLLPWCSRQAQLPKVCLLG